MSEIQLERNLDNPIFEKYIEENKKGLKRYIIIVLIVLAGLIYSHHLILTTICIIWSICHIFKRYFSINVIVEQMLADAKRLRSIEYYNAIAEVAPEKKWICQKEVYDIYRYSDNLEMAYNYAKENNVSLDRNEKKNLFKNLNKYDEIIELLQTEYSKEEKDEHPSLYAELAEAFMAIDKPEIALQVLTDGPMSKRKMNDEMCSYRYALGCCFEKLGKVQEAKKQFNKIYAYNANYKGIADRI